jgi:hypothetical protein
MQGPLLCTSKCVTGMHQTMAWFRDARIDSFSHLVVERWEPTAPCVWLPTVVNRVYGTLILFHAFPPFIPMDLPSRK